MPRARPALVTGQDLLLSRELRLVSVLLLGCLGRGALGVSPPLPWAQNVPCVEAGCQAVRLSFLTPLWVKFVVNILALLKCV